MSKWTEWTSTHVRNAQAAFSEILNMANMGYEVPVDEARRALENMVFCAETPDTKESVEAVHSFRRKVSGD